MLSTYACVIGVKPGACKRWCHHYMTLQRSKIPPTQKKYVGGLPHTWILFIANQELQIPFYEWPNNMPQLWGLKHIWWQASKCHMGWWLGCRIFCGQFNQDVIWKIDLWHVWPKYKAKNKCSTCCVHIDGTSIQLNYT
jgi:hypothetical protein